MTAPTATGTTVPDWMPPALTVVMEREAAEEARARAALDAALAVLAARPAPLRRPVPRDAVTRAYAAHAARHTTR